ncbi:MAG: class I SAM-dependent methyltransferase [Chloroflexota bacterium]
MNQSLQFYAETYDAATSDWPGEIDFYQQVLQDEAHAKNGAVLEVACGTGRIALRLAESGVRVVGIDLSAAMIEQIRQKSEGMTNVRWAVADMRSFALNETFTLAIIPGHSFQHLTTPEDQLACLESIKHHLAPGALLVVHLDNMSTDNVKWLGKLCDDEGGVHFPSEPFRHPSTGVLMRNAQAWTYDPLTQTTTSLKRWEMLDEEGHVVDSWDAEPVPLHAIFPFEMAQALGRAGFTVEAVYGDFDRQAMSSDSESMIWMARNRIHQ